MTADDGVGLWAASADGTGSGTCSLAYPGTPAPHAACVALDVPVLIVDGAQDIRPRSAVDSPERAPPHGFRTAVVPALR